MMLSWFFPLFFFNVNLNCSKCCIQKEQRKRKYFPFYSVVCINQHKAK